MSAPVAPPPPPEFLHRAEALGVELTSAQLTLLQRYLDRLLETNQRVNLTRVTAPDQVWTRHVLDSLSLLPELTALPEGSEVADIGSGGGLPAIPLAIAAPGLRFTMVEATGKKAAFLAETARALGLDAEVTPTRVEEFGRGAGRERFAAVTSRALAALNVLVELAVPLLRVGGVCLCIKGERADDEVAQAQTALRELDACWERSRRGATGTVLVLRKQGPTVARYPRRVGVPAKRPL